MSQREDDLDFMEREVNSFLTPDIRADPPPIPIRHENPYYPDLDPNESALPPLIPTGIRFDIDKATTAYRDAMLNRARLIQEAIDNPEIEQTLKNRNHFTKYRGPQSFVFKVGERRPGTMLTVLGPGFENRYGMKTWQEILCKCDCGREVKVSYAAMYQSPGKFSCGCTRRRNNSLRVGESVDLRREEQIEYSGMRVEHHVSGRELAILSRDKEFHSDVEEEGTIMAWSYVTACCGEIMRMPCLIRTENSVLNKLYRTAGKSCPNPKCRLYKPDR